MASLPPNAPLGTIDSRLWLNWFLYNQAHLAPVDWQAPYHLTAQEREIIAASIRQFQLGESSEGRHLIQQARRYVSRAGDADYLEAVKLFIGEEQRHAAELGRFMYREHIEKTRGHWVDSVFRRLRQLANLEVSVVVLLTAEIIAIPYYTALRAATCSPILKQICGQILRDEVQHVHFQVNTLVKLREKRHFVFKWLTDGLEYVLFCGTLLVVWSQHYRVFQAGGTTFAAFWRHNWALFHQLFIQYALVQQDAAS